MRQGEIVGAEKSVGKTKCKKKGRKYTIQKGQSCVFPSLTESSLLVTNMPDTNCSISTESVVSNPASTSLGALILTIVFLLGFPGNIFVIWSVLARARKQSVTTLLILNLAIADGSLMALTPFFIAYLIMRDWTIGKVMCKVLYYLCLANMYASIYLIMLMSVYRLVSVVWPKRISVITGKRTFMRVLAVVWLLVILASIPALLYRNIKKNNDNSSVCDSLHDKESEMVLQYTLEIFLGFLIPYGVILASYICILRRIRQTKFRRRIRSERLILAIVVTFCLFWLPYHLINLLQVSWALSPECSVTRTWLAKVTLKVRAFTSAFAFISSCINPVLYFFAGKSYIRREGLAFMARLFEGTGLDSTRKSRMNSQNSRDKDKDAEVVLQDKEAESSTNSSSNVK